MRKYCIFLVCILFHYIASAQIANYEYSYWFDSDIEDRQTGVTDAAQWNLQIDVGHLSVALHQLHIQVRDTAGHWSVPYSSYFLKVTTDQSNALAARYWFDDGAAIETTVTNGVHDIDVSALSPGLHYLHYQVQRADGGYSAVNTAMFVKDRNGVDIVRYDYWVNDDPESLRLKVARSGNSVYSLNDSLEVASYPVNLESFHFDISEGTPYIYGKNKLHARFYNSNNAFAEDSATYIDGSSQREVTGILLLESGKPRTDATPDTDSIRWYRIEATAGKGLSFCVSQPCTVQLFSPEGARLLDLSGEAVTDTFVCYAATGGSYYVALHSVTGTEAQTTISYLHGVVMYHQLTYLVDGEMYMSQVVATGDSIALLAAPVKDNRPFSGWMGAPEVMPEYDVTVRGAFEYRVSYVVLDSVLWNTGYYYGEEINDSPEPEKIWYLFDGWDGLPETMVARDISVTARFVFLYELGDVNGDDRISVSDITVLTNHIMKLPNTTFIRDAADLNGDGRISVVDVTMTTNKILSDEE